VKEELLKEQDHRLTPLKKEVHGQGCGCPSCLRSACHDLNQWTDWVAGENANQFPHYRVNPKTRKIEEYFPGDEE
jgi:hypothetical protein